MKKLGFIFSLLMLIGMLWSVVIPVHANSENTFGSSTYGPTGPGGCCDYDDTGTCINAASEPGGEVGSLGCTSQQTLIWCHMYPSYTGRHCELNGEIPCFKLNDPSLCNSTQSMECAE